MSIKKIFNLFIALLLIINNPLISHSEVPGDIWSNYNQVLAKVTKPIRLKTGLLQSTHTAVNYEILIKSKELLEQQKNILKLTQLPKDRNEQLAFWINAYNFFTLVDVAREYSVKSMREIGWENKRHQVESQEYSLDEIENKILRPIKDPRIHFAINCASTSCPSLRTTAYSANNINSELDESVKNALRSPMHIQLKKDFWGNQYLSTTKLFQWFKDDFKVEPYESEKGFIHNYAPAEYKRLNINANLVYNWDLNNEENIDKHLKSISEAKI